MSYEDTASTIKAPEKNDRTRFLHLMSGCCVFELIMRVKCPVCPVFRIAGIQYTHFQAPNALYVNILTFLIAQGLTSVMFSLAGAQVWTGCIHNWAHGARRLNTWSDRLLGRSYQARYIGTGGTPGGPAGAGVGCPAFLGPSWQNCALRYRDGAQTKSLAPKNRCPLRGWPVTLGCGSGAVRQAMRDEVT